MAVYGIDLGTTYSSIAYVDATGRPSVVPNTEGDHATPSAVYFEAADKVIVGTAAAQTAVVEPELVVDLIKRAMGKHETLVMHGRRFTPEEISALILRRLMADVEALTGETPTDAVITVPAYFGTPERLATMQAGQIAGLNVIDVLSEPIAAALSYGALNASSERAILVYDLGGGTFDTTVLRIAEDGDIHEISTKGHPALGGVEWDERLAEYVVDRFMEEHPGVPHPFSDPTTVQDIRSRVEEAKRHLSEAEEYTLRLVHAGEVSAVTITRAKFEEITRDLLDTTIEITMAVLAEARERDVDHIDQILLVGGSSRMPAVAARLTEVLGQEPILHDPDLAVAKGAALHALEETYRRLVSLGQPAEAQSLARFCGLSPEQELYIANRSIHRVAGRGFGVLCHDAVANRYHVMPLIKSDDLLPASATRTFYSSYDSQKEIGIQIMEQVGESDDPADHRLVAAATLPLPPDSPAGTAVDVTFQVSTAGALEIEGIPLQTGALSAEEVEAARDYVANMRIA